MPDVTRNSFNTPEELLSHLKSRADDIDLVVIHPPGCTITRDGIIYSGPFPSFAMEFKHSDGKNVLIFGEQIEMVLNDGILNRLRIKIELGK
jgi:methyl coenzyme M reductase subunit D